MSNSFTFRDKARDFVRWRLRRRATRQPKPIAQTQANDQVRSERGANDQDMIARFRQYEYPIDDEWGAAP